MARQSNLEQVALDVGQIGRGDEDDRGHDGGAAGDRERTVRVCASGNADARPRLRIEHIAHQVELARHQSRVLEGTAERVDRVPHVRGPVEARVDLAVRVTVDDRIEATAGDDGVACDATDCRRIRDLPGIVRESRAAGLLLFVRIERIRAEALAQVESRLKRGRQIP